MNWRVETMNTIVLDDCLLINLNNVSSIDKNVDEDNAVFLVEIHEIGGKERKLQFETQEALESFWKTVTRGAK